MERKTNMLKRADTVVMITWLKMQDLINFYVARFTFNQPNRMRDLVVHFPDSSCRLWKSSSSSLPALFK